MNKKTRKILIIICAAVALCCAIALGVLLSRVIGEKQAQQQIAEMLATPDPDAAATPRPSGSSEILEKYAKIAEANPDVAGWLKIDGTAVNYAVMYTPNEPDKYLSRGFYGDYALSGSLYIDARCDLTDSDNLIIYGHNMVSGEMFGQLKNYADKAFWEEHKKVNFDTLYQECVYEIFAVFKTEIKPDDDESYRYYTFFGSETEEEFNEYIDYLEEVRLYDTGETARYGDKLVTLSTCSYHHKEGRFVVVAKLIEE